MPEQFVDVTYEDRGGRGLRGTPRRWLSGRPRRVFVTVVAVNARPSRVARETNWAWVPSWRSRSTPRRSES